MQRGALSNSMEGHSRHIWWGGGGAQQPATQEAPFISGLCGLHQQTWLVYLDDHPCSVTVTVDSRTNNVISCDDHL